MGREKSGMSVLRVVAGGLRLGSGPKDRRETPDELSLGTCLLVLDTKLLRYSAAILRDSAVMPRVCTGVAAGGPARLVALEDAVDPTARLRLRIVTLGGTAMAVRGDGRGGVLAGPGAGSLERAE
jgi:hypothetical protein